MHAQGAKSQTKISATRVVASTLGILVGIAGIEHGLFEMLQGNVVPTGLIIDAIGPAQELWPGAAEPALTVIPNLFLTGILAMIVGLLTVIWAAAFIERRHGPLTLLLLSAALLLVGGGSPPIFLGVLASVVATRINKPLTWWRVHLPVNVRGFLAKLWPWSIIAFVLLFLFSVVIAITGWPFTFFFDANNIQTDLAPILYILGYVSEGLLILSIVTGFAYDIQITDRSHQTPPMNK